MILYILVYVLSTVYYMPHEIPFVKIFLKPTVLAVDFSSFSFSFTLINITSLRSRLPHPSFLSSFSQISFLNEIPNSYFIRKCDICEIRWKPMRLKILTL